MNDKNEVPIVAVIGPNGFIGRKLVNALLAQNNVLIRALERSLSSDKQHPNLTVIQGDLCKLETLQNLLVTDCIVINLAYSFKMSREYNLLATKNLAKICKSRKIKRLIHCSTVSVYGRSPNDIVNEESVCYPFTEYAKAKLSIEQILLDASRGNFEFVNLRLASVFGSDGNALSKLIADLTRGSMMLNYFKACLFNKRKLNLVSVETLTAAIIFVMNPKLKVDGHTFIVSEDYESINNFHYVEQYLLNKLIKKNYILGPVNIPLQILSFFLRVRGRDSCNPSRLYDPSKILKIGFNPPRTLQQSLDSFIEWHKAHYVIDKNKQV